MISGGSPANISACNLDPISGTGTATPSIVIFGFFALNELINSSVASRPAPA